MMINKAIDEKLGKPRKDATTEEFKHIQDNLEEMILQPQVRRLRKAKSDYEQKNKV